ncbi:MAG: 4-alpha-glucanotransferase, partial [Clostridia bacterium]|nr:4-alpha-glucanotransferase [Clostridia bacterium]
MKRESGVLMHVSTLWGDFGIGSFGKEARAFVDFLATAGYSWWQVLPFSMPDEYGSPYKSYSAFAGNPYFIDLPTLWREGLITDAELAHARQRCDHTSELARLREERIPLLLRAAARVKDTAPILAFLEEKPEVAQLCRYMALRHANGDTPWQEWTVTEPDGALVLGWAFIQYTFFRQWASVKQYAHERGVRILGDIPIYVSCDSADVWASPHLFDLNAKGYPRRVSGVPPDYFAEDGQLWGNPLYRWDVMKRDGYAWWQKRLSLMLELFDGVRIDHFRAIEHYWSVPASARTAREGKWVKGPGAPFLRAMKEVAGDKLLIAEDLGDITPAVHRLMKQAGLPGMRVFQFAFLGDPSSPHLPHNYPENCVAYTGTHDNNTLLGYIWEQDSATREKILAYCQYTGENWDGGYDNIIRTMLASHARLTVFPIQDLLHYGCDCRLNTPGKAEGNWTWRLTARQMQELDPHRLRRDNELYGRV